MSRPRRWAGWALAFAGLVFLPACMMTEMPPWDWPGAVLQSIHDLSPQGTVPATNTVKSTPISSPSATGSTYVFFFDSKMTTLVTPGVEHIRARVSLHPREGSEELIGEAPVEIVSADGDSLSGGACRNNSFKEEPGVLRVLYGKVDRDAAGDFTAVKLIYTLDPQIECTVDGHFGPNQWNLFWMVYDGHFTHTDDLLDETGPEPLITVGHWHFNGPSAVRVYQWSSAAVAEDTTIRLDPVTP
jgi:hypothetical protein